MSAGMDGRKHRVLFVGNSLTCFRTNRLDVFFREMGYDASSKITMGATLADIWRQGGWAETIGYGGYDTVVIQDDLPEYKELPHKRQHWREVFDEFLPAVTSFVNAITAAGARPIIYMAHSYPRLPMTQHHDICMCHAEAEQALDVTIAPGALAHHMAFMRAFEITEWSLPLLEPDREHPSAEGLYLHACCIALAMLPASAEGDVDLDKAVPWAPSSFEDGKASFLKGVARDAAIAWRTYAADTGPDPKTVAMVEKYTEHSTTDYDGEDFD